jgi:TonB-dependent receptor
MTVKIFNITNSLEVRASRKISGFRYGVSLLALSIIAASGPASAQTKPADSGDADEIVVTGIKGSLQKARDIKKSSSEIVDSVTADDIGALPDRSVTETLQRIPGISITRFAALVDPDHFSVEGSGVTIRGLNFTRSEINGREAFTANNGRGLGFADIPSELLKGVDVYKSPSAELTEGGTSGLVNLRTRLPFDDKDQYSIAGSVENNYSDFAKKSSPTVSLLGRARWETGIGEIGILGSFVYSQLKTRSDGVQLSAFRERRAFPSGGFSPGPGETAATPTTPVAAAAGAAIRSQDTNRERYGYSGALQWKSNSGALEATFQFLRSDSRQAWTERAVEVTTDNVESQGGSRPLAGTRFAYDNTGLFDSGTITGTTGWRADARRQFAGNGSDFNNDQVGNGDPGRNNSLYDVRTPINGLQSNNIRRDKKTKNLVDDYGANVKWNASDHLSFKFDYQHVNSSVDDLDVSLWTSTYQNVFIDRNGRNLPIVRFLPPEVCSGPLQNTTCEGVPNSLNNPTYLGAGHTSYTDPYNSFYRSALDHIEQSEGKLDAFKLDGDFELPDNDWLKSIRAGYRHTTRRQTARFSEYNWGVLSEQWGGTGPVFLDERVDGNPQTGNTGGNVPQITEPFFFSNFLGGRVDNPLNGQGRLFTNFSLTDNYARFGDVTKLIGNESGLGGNFVTTPNRSGVIAGTPFRPGEINQQRELNNSVYLQANFDHAFSSAVNLSGNIGVRYVRVKRVSTGFQQFNAPQNGFVPETAAAGTDSCAAQLAAVALANSNPVGPRSFPFGFCALTLQERNTARAFANGVVAPSVRKLNYDYVLPSFNAKLEVGGGIQFRAAYAKTLTPAEFGLTRNFFNLGVGAVQNADANGTLIPGSFRLQAGGNAGNPFLLPITADNFDLTAEWYFGSGGQLTLAGFHKVLRNQQTNGIARADLTNNGATVSGVVTAPTNASGVGKVSGFELGYQQNYDFLPGILSGFGMAANYTYITSSGLKQSTLSATDPDVAAGRNSPFDIGQLSLAGLSKHQVNIAPYYQKGPLEVRAAYSWRSRYTLTIRDVITPFEPTIAEATGQLDASVFVTVSPQLKLGIQGVNLLDEISRTSSVYTTDGSGRDVARSFFKNDRRFTFLARFNF